MTCGQCVSISCIALYVVVLSLCASGAQSNLMGVDFGSDSYKVVLAPGAGRKQMQLVFNDASSRKTTNVIGFRPNERLFDSDAVSLVRVSFSVLTSLEQIQARVCLLPSQGLIGSQERRDGPRED
jgi:hypothetical protein